MNYSKTKSVAALTLTLSISILSFCTHAASLVNGNVLTLSQVVYVGDIYGYDGNYNGYAIYSGSWFAMDTDGNHKIAGTEKVALSEGTTGLVIGTTTSAGASHAGAPTAGDTNAITAPWNFFGNTGSDFLTVAVTGDTTSGLNMSGWTVTWNGVPTIPMGSGAWVPLSAGGVIPGMVGGSYTNGVAKFNWNGIDGGAYTLDYLATVPLNDASNFGGVKYALHLEGTVMRAVPEASTYAMMLAGLGLVGFMSRRRKLAEV